MTETNTESREDTSSSRQTHPFPRRRLPLDDKSLKGNPIIDIFCLYLRLFLFLEFLFDWLIMKTGNARYVQQSELDDKTLIEYRNRRPLVEFHEFPKLPVEVRLNIWECEHHAYMLTGIWRDH